MDGLEVVGDVLRVGGCFLQRVGYRPHFVTGGMENGYLAKAAGVATPAIMASKAPVTAARTRVSPAAGRRGPEAPTSPAACADGDHRLSAG
jgi:hypothetical protein